MTTTTTAMFRPKRHCATRQLSDKNRVNFRMKNRLGVSSSKRQYATNRARQIRPKGIYIINHLLLLHPLHIHTFIFPVIISRDFIV
jgi:hypothetical protein